jgi:hypothetical protein
VARFDLLNFSQMTGARFHAGSLALGQPIAAGWRLRYLGKELKMLFFDNTLAGACVQAMVAAGKSDQRELARCTATTAKSHRLGSMASVMAQLNRVFARASKALEGVGLIIETRSRPF